MQKPKRMLQLNVLKNCAERYAIRKHARSERKKNESVSNFLQHNKKLAHSFLIISLLG